MEREEFSYRQEFGQVLGLGVKSCLKYAQVRTGFGVGSRKLSEVGSGSDRFWG